MFKTIVLIKKKHGMSMDEFISYYENKHVLLAVRVIPNLKKYVRHFLRPYGNDTYQAGEEQPYHVATEMWYEDKASFKKAMIDLTAPKIAALIGADEAMLFDRSSIRFMLTESYETELPRADRDG